MLCSFDISGKGSLKYIMQRSLSMSRFLELCEKVRDQLKTWMEARNRVLAHLNSIQNLVGQLETLQRCCGSHNLLGVVGELPLCVQLLEVKLVQAMERAFSAALKEK